VWAPTDVASSLTSDGLRYIVGVPRIGSASVNPQSFTATMGQWAVDIQGEPSIQLAMLRGSLVQLFCVLPDCDAQPVALGMVVSVRGNGARMTIQCWDAGAALRSRLTTTVSQLQLFYDIAAKPSTTLTADYTAGASTLSVDETYFDRQAPGTGAVLVAPAGGAAFYLTYTGEAAGQLTGVSASGAWGTTAVDAATGDTVYPLAYIYGHPFDIVRKILTSGSGAGTYDVLPDAWGVALPGDFIDDTDIDNWKNRVNITGGTLSYDLVIGSATDDGWGLVQGMLAVMGCWLTTRQGQLTVRGVLDMSSDPGFNADTIHDGDLLTGDSWSYEIPDPAFSREYGGVSIRKGDATVLASGTSTGCESLPAMQSLIATLMYGLVDLTTGTTEAEEIRDRIKPWMTRPMELLTLQCRGWRLAKLAVGDLVKLQLSTVRGRLTAYGKSYGDTTAVVAEIAPDFSSYRTTVKVWPLRETAV
jgi:hypothetical protein